MHSQSEEAHIFPHNIIGQEEADDQPLHHVESEEEGWLEEHTPHHVAVEKPDTDNIVSKLLKPKRIHNPGDTLYAVSKNNYQHNSYGDHQLVQEDKRFFRRKKYRNTPRNRGQLYKGRPRGSRDRYRIVKKVSDDQPHHSELKQKQKTEKPYQWYRGDKKRIGPESNAHTFVIQHDAGLHNGDHEVEEFEKDARHNSHPNKWIPQTRSQPDWSHTHDWINHGGKAPVLLPLPLPDIEDDNAFEALQDQPDDVRHYDDQLNKIVYPHPHPYPYPTYHSRDVTLHELADDPDTDGHIETHQDIPHKEKAHLNAAMRHNVNETTATTEVEYKPGLINSELQEYHDILQDHDPHLWAEHGHGHWIQTEERHYNPHSEVDDERYDDIPYSVQQLSIQRKRQEDETDKPQDPHHDKRVQVERGHNDMGKTHRLRDKQYGEYDNERVRDDIRRHGMLYNLRTHVGNSGTDDKDHARYDDLDTTKNHNRHDKEPEMPFIEYDNNSDITNAEISLLINSDVEDSIQQEDKLMKHGSLNLTHDGNELLILFMIMASNHNGYR